MRPTDGRWGRGAHVVCGWLTVQGLLAPQGEFTFGVPQFNLLFSPILVCLAAGLGLVAFRLVHGRWWTARPRRRELHDPGHRLPRLRRRTAARSTPASARPSWPARVVVELVARVAGHRATAPGSPCSAGSASARSAWPASTSGTPAPGSPGRARSTRRRWCSAWSPPSAPPCSASRSPAPSSGTAGRALPRAPGRALAALGLPRRRRCSRCAAPPATSRPPSTSSPPARASATVVATLTPADAADDAYWFQASAWQGGGLELADMEPTGTPGEYRSDAARADRRALEDAPAPPPRRRDDGRADLPAGRPRDRRGRRSPRSTARWRSGASGSTCCARRTAATAGSRPSSTPPSSACCAHVGAGLRRWRCDLAGRGRTAGSAAAAGGDPAQWRQRRRRVLPRRELRQQLLGGRGDPAHRPLEGLLGAWRRCSAPRSPCARTGGRRPPPPHRWPRAPVLAGW